MRKIKNTDFFKQAGFKSTNTSSKNKDSVKINVSHQTNDNTSVRVVQVSQELIENVKKTARVLKEIELRALSNEVVHLYSKLLDEHFTVAVVGEFSKGKSTLINKLLGKEVLPTSVLPTTALLTRITSGEKEKMIVVGTKGQKQQELALEHKSWEGLTAANFTEKEPEGHVIVEIVNDWMSKYRIDILDTPGAGDLEEKRARVIEKCLVGADAAIVTISATKILSLTEQEFIRHKIVSRGIPFIAIALTQMDMISPNEREGVLSFLFKKLENLKIRIPVFVTDDNIEIPGNKYQEIIGFKRFKSLILSWLSHEKRRELTEHWLTTNINGIIQTASKILDQQKVIVDSKGEEKERLIAQRNEALSHVHSQWQKLRDEMTNRCEVCVNLFNDKAKECGEQITEALQHEVGKQPNPKDWLENEYAYRVKRELSGVSITLDNLVARQISKDLKWLNEEMSRQFKEVVNITPEGLMAKEDFRPDVNDKSLKLEDLKDQSTKATIMSSALTLGAALLLGVSGAAPLLFATMGVGTGANIISKKLLEKKGDGQRQELKNLIAQEMPRIIHDASSDSSVKIKILYNDIISESLATETRWMQTQRAIIRQTTKVEGEEEAKNKLSTQIKAVEELKSLF